MLTVAEIVAGSISADGLVRIRVWVGVSTVGESIVSTVGKSIVGVSTVRIRVIVGVSIVGESIVGVSNVVADEFIVDVFIFFHLVIIIDEDIRTRSDVAEKIVRTSFRILSVDGCSCDSSEHEENKEFYPKVVRRLRRSW